MEWSARRSGDGGRGGRAEWRGGRTKWRRWKYREKRGKEVEGQNEGVEEEEKKEEERVKEKEDSNVVSTAGNCIALRPTPRDDFFSRQFQPDFHFFDISVKKCVFLLTLCDHL
ncbi:hypothetical protein Pmani_029759 [Petrolisthes manimaculis]|uniref:Uncharacterized protein n=1 Tax=Petrolisthes manimaculis TaxID=1843537 RepID=A0AAE1NZH4_9EUCA|nr:hypothetical protein Pmani_029759 [Petrolisthes manimaculis]